MTSATSRRDEQDAQAPVGAFAGRDPFVFLLPLGAFLLGTRVEEGGLELVELCTRIAVQPVARGLKARTAIELAGITAERIPVFGSVREVPVRAQTFTIVVEPPPQPRPFADQCFVGDLDGVIVDGDQTPVSKVAQHLVDGVGIGARHELGAGHAPPGVLRAFPQLGEPQEDAAARSAVAVQSATRSTRSRRCERSRCVRRLNRDIPRASTLCRSGVATSRATRETATATTRVRGEVAQDDVDEPRLDRQPGDLGRRLDRPPKFVLVHLPQQDVRVRERSREARDRRTVSVEVSPQRADGHDGAVACFDSRRAARRRSERARSGRGIW